MTLYVEHLLIHLLLSLFVLLFKQKTAYDMRISDWSSDVCSSDLGDRDLPRIDAQRCRSVGIRGPDPADQQAFRLQAGKTARGQKDAAIRRWLRQIGRASCRARVCQ